VHGDYPKSRPQHSSYLNIEILINRKISFFFARADFHISSSILIEFIFKCKDGDLKGGSE
jgi:hypothetical protein